MIFMMHTISSTQLLLKRGLAGRLRQGGQHVNKPTAPCAPHVATGLSVKVQSERSQHSNKRLAGQLLAAKLVTLGKAAQYEGKAERRLQHHQSERDNATRMFAGMDFREQAGRCLGN
jgi:peptide chain release factor